jgi:hypothetical protein
MIGEGIQFDCEGIPLGKASLATMKSMVYVDQAKGDQVEVQAPLAPDLFLETEGRQFRYWMWRINSKRSHLIEGVSVREK